MKTVMNTKSPLWDVVVGCLYATLLWHVPSSWFATDLPWILTMVLGPLLFAGCSMARNQLSDKAVENLVVAGGVIALIGTFLMFGAGIYSAMYSPNETMCVGDRCAWNPTGTSMLLLVSGMLVILFAAVEFTIAIGIVILTRSIASYARADA